MPRKKAPQDKAQIRLKAGKRNPVIVYSATRAEFTQDVFSNQIEQKILAALKTRAGISTGLREIELWKNSMQYMNK